MGWMITDSEKLINELRLRSRLGYEPKRATNLSMFMQYPTKFLGFCSVSLLFMFRFKKKKKAIFIQKHFKSFSL